MEYHKYDTPEESYHTPTQCRKKNPSPFGGFYYIDFGIFYYTDFYAFDGKEPEMTKNELNFTSRWEKRFNTFEEKFFSKICKVFKCVEVDSDAHCRGNIYTFKGKDFYICVSSWEDGDTFIGFYSATLSKEALQKIVDDKMPKFVSCFPKTKIKYNGQGSEGWHSFYNG